MHIKKVIKVDIYESNMDLPNRYDLMIKMDLSQKALEEFDNGEIHKEWKEKFGKYIMNKTIFNSSEEKLEWIKIEDLLSIKQFEQNEKFTPFLFKDELFEGKFLLDDEWKVVKYEIRNI